MTDVIYLHPQGAKLIEAQRSESTAADWDEFARSCGASFRCAYRATRAWQLEHHLRFTLLRFDLVLVVGRRRQKVGQCAIGVGRRLRVFADGIQLLPGYDQLWPHAMRAVLAEVGPGRFRYGSEWSLERCRLDALQRLGGVQPRQVRAIDVQAVDFRQWSDWEAYFQAVSSNVRRNVKKAGRAHADLAILERRRKDVFRDFLAMQVARYRLFMRKGVRRSFPALALRSLFRLLFIDAYATSARCTSAAGTLAHYAGIDFGKDTFFLEAAARPNNEGASWYLLMAVMAEAYRRSGGQGRFVMGPDEQLDRGDPAWEGLVRSRQQCRVTSHPASIVTFDFDGTDSAAEPGSRGFELAL